MCGIAGFAGFTDRYSAEDRVLRMMRSLERRGPDAEGMETWDGAVLGHRRLSIFDLSELGRQPMCTPDRSLAVVFNGAIYNFHDLRADLMQAGYRFRSQTDTEVLLHGYREWGIDRLVQKLRGMFAFAIWDDRAQRLLLVRDRLGVKPLCYVECDGALAFASTPRALRDAGIAGDIDADAVVDYLEYGYVTDDRSIYRNVSKVPAATILEWCAGKLRSREYWKLPEEATTGAPGFEDAVEETERLLLKSVELRLNADVPVGALLSGGIDSSLVCWAVTKLGGDLTAFTVGTAGDPLDETSDAVITARHLGIRHRVIEASESEAPEIDELVAAYGEPFACASALGVLRVSRAIKPSATVLLTGEGGDDVFLGYPEHRHLWDAQRLAAITPTAVARSWTALRRAIPQAGPLRRMTHFLDYAYGGVGAVASAHPGLPAYGNLPGERLADCSVPQRSIPWSPEAGRQVLQDFLRYDRRGRFVGEYMTKVDGGTMRFALEARAPFLDQELWNFAATLPFGIRLRGGRSKAVLRELARRHLGDRLANAPKRGFSIPVERWMVGRWREAVDSVFANPLLAAEGWIRGEVLQAEWKRIRTQPSAPTQFWYLFVLESWFRQERAVESAASPRPRIDSDSVVT
jgi:asparagine synthase (glutamine-hydrolysing)